MRMRRPLIHVLALVLGAASALLVACGSSDNPHLLSAARADRLQSELDNLRDAVNAHQCQQAADLALRLQDEVTSLPNDTDPRLRQRLQEGATNLKLRAEQDCVKTTPTVTETQTQTTTTETQTTETTPTETQKTTTTPTTTTTTPTTTTPTTTSPDNGGSTAPPGG
jgi:cell division septation protein DedD